MPIPFYPFSVVATAYGITSPVVSSVIKENPKGDKKLCGHCGAEVGLDDKYCSKCGKELGYIKENESQDKGE